MSASHELAEAARQLAGSIEAGEYSLLTEEQRFQLRRLGLALAGWADRVETIEREAAPVPARCRPRPAWFGTLRGHAASIVPAALSATLLAFLITAAWHLLAAVSVGQGS